MDKDDDKNKKIIIVILIIVLIIIILLLRGCKEETIYNVTLKNGNTVQTITTNSAGFCRIPNNPEKEGYAFVGWYLDDEKINFNEAFDRDVVLEAKWEKIEKEESVPSDQDINIEDEEVDEKDFSEIKNKVVKNKNTKKTVEQPIQQNTPPAASSTVSVNEIIISKDYLELEISETSKLNATIKPDNASDKNITWSSSNPQCAIVDQNGNVTAVVAGTTKITATAGGKTVVCKVKVNEITYSIEWKIEDGTAIEQYRLYILGSNGKYASGTIEITTLAGDTFEETITENGSINSYIKSAIQSVKIK